MYHIYDEPITDEEVISVVRDLFIRGEITEEEYNLIILEHTKVSLTKEDKYCHLVNSYRKLSRKEIHNLDMDALCKYRRSERTYNLENIELWPVDLRVIFHPMLLEVLKIYHKHEKINIKVRGEVPKTNRPIIFAASHIGAFDVDAAIQTIKKQAYLLSADEEGMYRTLGGMFYDLEGVNYVIPEDDLDSEIALKTVKKYLRNRRNVYWNPEGIWNLTENIVILPLHYGIIEAAYEEDALILPIGINQIDKEDGIEIEVNIGEFFDPKLYIPSTLTEGLKIELAEELRSIMARLKYDLYPEAKRSDIPDDYYEKFLEARLKEWPFYTIDKIRSRMFNPNHYVYERDVFAHLNEIQINEKNAFLARTRKKFNEYHAKDVF